MDLLGDSGKWRKNGHVVHDYTDVRRFPRVRLEEGYSIQFQAGDRRFFGLPLTSLGGGGCCFQVSSLLAKGLQPGTVLTRVSIVHPDIPQTQQQARISWVLGNHRGHQEPTALVGIEFLSPDAEFLGAIEFCIAKVLEIQK